MTEQLKIRDIARAAQGQWGNIFPALEITVPARGKKGACPVCGGKDRFRVDDKEGKGTWFCNQCDPHAGDGLDLVCKVTGNDKKAASLLVAQALGLSAGIDMATIKANETKAKQQAEQERQREQARRKTAAELAQTILNQCQPAKGHPYLVGKGLAECEVLILQSPVMAGNTELKQGVSVIPLYNAVGELTTCQTIDDTGHKYLLSGGRKAGSFHRIAGSEVLAICEGYATGLSVHLATGFTVYCAVDAGNLRTVAETVREQHPHAEIIFAADNDNSPDKPINTGLVKAQEAVAAIGGRVALPPVSGDWNDYHQQYGIDKTREAILMSRKQSNVVSLADKAKPAAKAPKDDIKPRIETKGSDLVYIVPKMDKDTGEIHETQSWLCTAIELIGRGRDEDGAHFRMIRWKENGAGAERTDAFPLEIVGEREGWARMRRGGLSVTTSRLLRAYLGNHMQLAGSNQFWRVVSRSGWQHGAYVLPNAEVVGNPADPVFFNGRSASANAYRVSGTVTQWQEQVGALAQDNVCMMLGVACSLAAPLLDLVEADSFGVHLFGNSGTGKTTIGMVANSIWGHPEELKLSWYSTALGLANEAAAHNDGLMSLDEIGQSTKPKDVATSAYALFNGVGKIQGAKDGGNREAMRWRVLALSTGEKDLETFLHEAGEKVHAGHLVRLLNVPIQAIANIHGLTDSRAHADAVQQAAKRCYGAVGREWVNYLADHKEDVIQAIKTTTTAWQARLPEKASDQVRRVASRFAILEAALVCGSHLTGWTPDESKEAVQRCFNEWVALFGMENRERKTIIEQAVAFLNSNAFSRYMVIPYDCSQPTIRDPAGYRKQEGPNADGWTFYTFPHVFINETAHGFNPQAVAKILSDCGMLKHDKDREGRYTARLRVDGRYTRLYALLFASEGDAAQEDDV
jgi:putative DNA primase/helicase